MSWWTDIIIGVPRVTWKKLEDLVDEVYYLEHHEELPGTDRRYLAEELAVAVLEEYVQQYFGESVKSAAEAFRNRYRDTKLFLETRNSTRL